METWRALLLRTQRTDEGCSALVGVSQLSGKVARLGVAPPRRFAALPRAAGGSIETPKISVRDKHSQKALLRVYL